MKESHRRMGALPFLQILTILLLLSLLCFMLVNELLRVRNHHSTEQATVTSYTKTDLLTGYVFRNETALRSNNNGPITYFAREGEQLTAGSVVAEVYLDDTASDKREQAAALQQKIEICEIALAEQTTPWQGIYLSDYAALMGALGTGNFIAAEKSANGVAASLALRDATATQTADALRAEIAALQAQLQELVAYVDAPQSVPTEADGYFYRTVDGYEALFGTAAAQNLSPEGLETLLNSPTDTADCIGKMLRDGTWYLALPADAALAATYEVGASYTVRFESAALSTQLVLEQINFAANGESALLLLRGNSLPEGLDVCRRQSVLVEKETVQGLSVPAAALNEDGTVFVNENGVARVRRLSPVCDRPLLSLPGEAEGFLREGEQILVSTRSLYDGKVLE